MPSRFEGAGRCSGRVHDRVAAGERTPPLRGDFALTTDAVREPAAPGPSVPASRIRFNRAISTSGAGGSGMATCMRGTAGRSAPPGLAAALSLLATAGLAGARSSRSRLNLASARSSRVAVTSVAVVRSKGHAPPGRTQMAGYPNSRGSLPETANSVRNPSGAPTPIVRSRRARLTLPRSTIIPIGRHVAALITATRGSDLS
jgi:hypothetical protein